MNDPSVIARTVEKTNLEAAQLAAQLPQLIRGIFYEDWDPSRTPAHYRDLAEFLDRVAADAGLPGETSASFAVAVTSGVLLRHVSDGEIADIRAQLPKGLRPILEAAPDLPPPRPEGR